MRKYALLVAILFLVIPPKSSISAEKYSCTIEKKIGTGLVLEKPMVSTEIISIEAKPFGDNYIFPLAPANAECELRIPNPKGGTFLNCWTLDKKHGFRSDRTTIDKQKGIKNTLTYAEGEKNITVQVTVWCK